MGSILFYGIFVIAAAIEVAFFTLVVLFIYKFLSKRRITKSQIVGVFVTLMFFNASFGLATISTDDTSPTTHLFLTLYILTVLSIGLLVAKITAKSSGKIVKRISFGKVIFAICLGIVLFILFFVLYNVYQSHKTTRQINAETAAIREQENLLKLPQAQRRMEKNTGCTWSERQDWDTEGCYIAVMNVYDQKGPKTGLEEKIVDQLNKNGWQKRNNIFAWGSLATDMHGADIMFTKQTPMGKFCAGYDHRYFSDDIVNGHRALYFYILGPSDKSCQNG